MCHSPACSARVVYDPAAMDEYVQAHPIPLRRMTIDPLLDRGFDEDTRDVNDFGGMLLDGGRGIVWPAHD